MADLTSQQIVSTGAQPTYVAAAAGGDTIPADKDVFLHVRNGGGAAVDVTVVAVTACSHGFLHSQTVNVPAGQDRMVGTFDSTRFWNASGKISVTYSAVTSVTVAALKH